MVWSKNKPLFMCTKFLTLENLYVHIMWYKKRYSMIFKETLENLYLWCDLKFNLWSNVQNVGSIFTSMVGSKNRCLI